MLNGIGHFGSQHFEEDPNWDQDNNERGNHEQGRSRAGFSSMFIDQLEHPLPSDHIKGNSTQQGRQEII
jgi:hypothetical protein